MQYTLDEQRGWNDLADFLQPDNVIGDEWDDEALTLWLNSYISINTDQKYPSYPTENQVETVGVILKRLPDGHPLALDTFTHWYSQYRKTHHLYFQQWLEHMSAQRGPELLTWLRTALDGSPAIEVRVLMMMDGVQYYPNESVRSFVGKSLLRLKATSFLKALKPELAQMPLFLKMARDLLNAEPEFTEIAKAIAAGVFVARMAYKPENHSLQEQYSAIEALRLMADEHIPLTMKDYIAAAKSRFKGATVLSDLTQFVVWSLYQAGDDPRGHTPAEYPTDTEREMGMNLMLELMTELLGDPDYAKSNRYDLTFLRAYDHMQKKSGMQPDVVMFKDQLFEWFMRRSEKDNNMGADVLLKLLEVEPQWSTVFWERWMVKNDYATPEDMVDDVLHEQKSARRIDHQSRNEYIRALSSYAPAEAWSNALRKHAHRLFERKPFEPRPHMTHSPAERERDLHQHHANYRYDMERFFNAVRLAMTPELRTLLQKQSLVGATSMTYLYHMMQHPELKVEKTAILPNISAHPLPLLSMVYPEHALLFNTIRKSVIKKAGYYKPLYQSLGRALYNPETIDPDVVEGLSSVVNMDILSYFESGMVQDNTESFTLTADMFEL